MSLSNIIKKLLRHCDSAGHRYKFVQAWEASIVYYTDSSGMKSQILLATDDDPIALDEEAFKDLVYLDIKSGKNTEYLVNLKCCVCGHRITVSHNLFLADTEV